MKKIIFPLWVVSLLIVACGNDKTGSASPEMSNGNSMESKAEKNKQTALAGIMAVNSHDAAAVLKDMAADVTDYGDGSMASVKNADSIKAFVSAWLNAFPDIRGENFMALTDDGTNVAVVADCTGTFKNDLMGIKATGKSYHFRDVDILTFNEEGKVIAHRAIVPNLAVLNQVGAVMPQ